MTGVRQMLAAFWTPADASPLEAAYYRGRQLSALASQLLLSTSCTWCFAVAVVWSLWPAGHHTFLLACLLALLVNCGISIAIWSWWRRQPRHRPASRTACRWMVLQIGLAALIDALLAVHAFNVSSPETRLVVVATTAAFIAAGGWMMAVLPHAGLSWSLVFCATLALGFGVAQGAQLTTLIVLVACYGLVLSAASLLTSRLFLDRLVSERRLERQNQVVELLLNDFETDASDWLWEIDAQGRLRHASPRLAKLLNRSVADLQGTSFEQALAPLWSPELSLDNPISRGLRNMQPLRHVVVPVLLNGCRRWWSVSARPLFDPAGQPDGWRGVASDVTAAQERDHELHQLANVDALTGLANRHCFNGHLDALFSAAARPQTAALFLLDLDNFKGVNDMLGHAAGDELLRDVAQRLTAQVGEGHLLARLGGDEFALLVPGLGDRDAADALGARLLAAFGQASIVRNHHIVVFASIGVALVPTDAQDAGSLLQAADLALYAAKAAGRNSVRFFDATMDQAAHDRTTLLADLHQALALGQFVVHYQPQVDLATNRLRGFEALVRWHHPTRGIVGPAAFIPLAEDSGLIAPLGRWVLQQACQEATRWPADLSVAVNISAVEFERTDLGQAVRTVLAQSGLAPHRLELELTESTLLQDADTAVATLNGLRRLGVRMALDDFGTGYSSLAYLRTFPLDKLKIDRSFVKALDTGDDATMSLSIVRAIHSLAQALGLEVTAEGVETSAQRQTLAELGCEFGQGYLFARPLDAVQTEVFIVNAMRHGLIVASDHAQGERIADRRAGNPARETSRITGARPVLADSRWAAL